MIFEILLKLEARKKELFLRILKALSPSDFLRGEAVPDLVGMLVCKSWHQLGKSNDFWWHFAVQEWYEPKQIPTKPKFRRNKEHGKWFQLYVEHMNRKPVVEIRETSTVVWTTPSAADKKKAAREFYKSVAANPQGKKPSRGDKYADYRAAMETSEFDSD